ncbi:protein-L-isoaspartate(D-aspartate) O-methyltransferase [Haloarchaeobius iranensis]|uniref:Protein-L-isoaspartate O-methyltransferase n=1 Tax=Haloarchaeobius iranensis TaxID=996166 RepID=A0A1G9XLI6_9EURY|nr:protein-L-isoaspartate(D-aspartate) O-methyltransferase [Haloarchaeobius iranensis]SDM97628.1 protein-L-isoaspartate(D-aspartate) O-methyltransferase [Haloarchaeobius iranensis]
MSFEAARESLVDRLDRRSDIERESTLDAVRAVPRHEFVPESRRSEAYADRPLPIGDGATISAPHMVAIMVDALDLSTGDRVLEVGTGCGYHAAVTAEVVGAENVFSVEYSERLASEARERLDRLGYGAIGIRTGDGREGWPEHAPYDAAYLTCAAPGFPDAVVEQVRPGGVVLAPIGTDRQRLVHATRRADGSLDREDRGGVRFVRMQ